MAFRFKDLMIEVLPGDADAANATCPTLSMDPARQAGTCGTISMDPAQAACGGSICTTVSQGTALMAVAGCPAATGICGTLTMPPTPYALLAVCGGTLCGTLTMWGAAQVTGSLPALKQQLQQALQQIEAQERAAAQGAAAGLPTTAEEADDLQRRLNEAIEELQEHRKTLAPAKKGKVKR